MQGCHNCLIIVKVAHKVEVNENINLGYSQDALGQSLLCLSFTLPNFKVLLAH